MRTVSLEMARLGETYKPSNSELGVRTKLKALHLHAVYCSDFCEPHVVYSIEVSHVQRVIALHEVQAAGVAPGVAFQQAAKYACAAAAGLCQRGVPYDDVVVPLMVSTGLLELKGAAYMMDRLLPSSIVTSPTLDLTSERGVAAAHLYRMRAAEQVQWSKSLVRNALYSSAFVELRSSCFLSMAGSLLCLGFYLASLRTLYCPSGVPFRPPRPTALAPRSHTCTGLHEHPTQAMRHRSFASLSATMRESRVLQLAPAASR